MKTPPAGARIRVAPGQKHAIQVILLLGIVSLLADIVYEGGRSVSGPYLLYLGAGAFAVAAIAGLGEFIGYGLRLISGYYADRTKGYWTFTIAGYLMIGAIPLLVYAGTWEVAAVLMIVERLGKALRSPARDTILSHAAAGVGRGWGFGVHEALDQIGAILGPLVFTLAFIITGGYREGFALLVLPFLLMVVFLLIARTKVPAPEVLEIKGISASKTELTAISPDFYPYVLFTALTMAGYVVFPLLAFHYADAAIVPESQIPLFFAVAMAVDAVIALLAGRIYDHIGITVIITVPLFNLATVLTAFSSDYYLALTGAVLWGAAMGVQETVMRAAVADMTPVGKRGFAYGIFNAVYGGAWFAGSLVMGLLYGMSLGILVAYGAAMQILAIPVYLLLRKRSFHNSPG